MRWLGEKKNKMIQPNDLGILLNKKFKHLEIHDDLGFTEEYRMSVKNIIDLLIEINNKDFYCEDCKGTSPNSIQCENHSCPNMPCCEKPREECSCDWGEKKPDTKE